MRLGDRLRQLSVLASARLRSALTLLGIVVGSGAIVLAAGIVRGAESALLATAQTATGSDLIEARRQEPSARERGRGKPELSRADARAIAGSVVGRGRRVHAEASLQTRARSAGRERRVRVVSGSPQTRDLFRLELATGRFIDAGDLEARRRVCVVGDEVWRELLARAPLSAEPELVADGVSFRVIGVLRRKPMIGSTDGTRIWDRKVVVPETTYDALYAPRHGADRVLLQPLGATPAMPLDIARRSLLKLLERRHHGADGVELDDATTRRQQETILSIVHVLSIAIGALALLVGAINVANVMLVSVAERTREIGLRRALGATRRDVLVQFLLESSVLALAGGAVGVLGGSALVGVSGALLARSFGDFPASAPAWAIALGLGLSFGSGVVAGIMPALRAAALRPVDALRTD